jgi:hypothetical protein
VRLQRELMQAAALGGERFHRSTAEQIEYWADIGRRVADLLDPDTLLAIVAGLARVKVEAVDGPVVDPDEIFRALEDERRTSTLAGRVTGSLVRYQASATHPGRLERIGPDGTITLGQFQGGEFIAMTGSGR